MAKKPRSDSISLLFIDNSFTQRNNLPALSAEMAATRDLSVTHLLISAGSVAATSLEFRSSCECHCDGCRCDSVKIHIASRFRLP